MKKINNLAIFFLFLLGFLNQHVYASSRKTENSYSIIKKLDKGTFGQIYKAKVKGTKEHDSKVVIKIQNGMDQETALEFFSEQEILEKIGGEKGLIVKMYDSYYDIQNRCVLVLEYLSNGTLKEYIDEQKNISEKEIRRFAEQLLKGLSILKKHKILHMDLHCNNIMLDKENRIRIIDFGTAREIDESMSLKDNLRGFRYLKLEFSELFYFPCDNSYDWIAPELKLHNHEDTYINEFLKGRKEDNLELIFKIDTWSLGFLLYNLALKSYSRLYSKNISCDIEKLKVSNVSDALIDLISHLLVCNPQERYGLTEVKKHPWINKTSCPISKDLSIGLSDYYNILKREKKEQEEVSLDLFSPYNFHCLSFN